MTFVSIIMSIYNESKNIEKVLVSIQQQDYANWELIIVDDASLDDSYSIINRHAENDLRIKPLRNQLNIGLAASLNRALAVTKGELIARMDADDLCLPNRLSRQVTFFIQNPLIHVLGSGAIDVDQHGHILGETYRPELHADLVSRIYKENPFIHPTIMARRKFFEELGGYDEKLRRAQDYDLWLRGYHRFHYHNLQIPLICYRRSSQANYKNAIYSGFVLWRSSLHEGKLISRGWYALRPIGSTMVHKIIDKLLAHH